MSKTPDLPLGELPFATEEVEIVKRICQSLVLRLGESPSCTSIVGVALCTRAPRLRNRRGARVDDFAIWTFRDLILG